MNKEEKRPSIKIKHFHTTTRMKDPFTTGLVDASTSAALTAAAAARATQYANHLVLFLTFAAGTGVVVFNIVYGHLCAVEYVAENSSLLNGLSMSEADIRETTNYLGIMEEELVFWTTQSISNIPYTYLFDILMELHDAVETIYNIESRLGELADLNQPGVRSAS
jgi:hypothetical protein